MGRVDRMGSRYYFPSPGRREIQELDNLAGVPMLDVTELPPACPKCWTALDEEDLEEGACPLCGYELDGSEE